MKRMQAARLAQQLAALCVFAALDCFLYFVTTLTSSFLRINSEYTHFFVVVVVVVVSTYSLHSFFLIVFLKNYLSYKRSFRNGGVLLKRFLTMNMFTNKDYSKEFISKLPEEIQLRLAVLLQGHEELKAVEDNFEEKELEIRAKYDKEFAPLFARRRQIVTGESEPTEDEVKSGFPAEHEGKVSLTEGEETTEAGLGDFWLTVLDNHIAISELIKPGDELVLKHLEDISSSIIPGKRESFKVEFVFSPNEYLEETTLSFTVVSSAEEDKTTITKSPMTFKKGDFLYEEKTVKSKKKGETKTSKVKKPKESFFWIFREVEEDDEELQDVVLEEEQLLNLLHTLHHKVIPSAVNFFTGEMDGASDLNDEDDDEEEEDDDSAEY